MVHVLLARTLRITRSREITRRYSASKLTQTAMNFTDLLFAFIAYVNLGAVSFEIYARVSRHDDRRLQTTRICYC